MMKKLRTNNRLMGKPVRFVPVALALLAVTALGDGAARAEGAADAPIRFSQQSAPCRGEGQAAMLNAELGRLDDRMFEHLSQLVERRQNCPAGQAPAAPGDLCQLQSLLALRGAEMRRLSDGLGRAGLFFSRASMSGRRAEELLAEEIDLFGREALSRLQGGREALARGRGGSIDAAAWALVGYDLERLGNALMALGAVELANPAAGHAGRLLLRSGSALKPLAERLGAGPDAGTLARDRPELEAGISRLERDLRGLIALADATRDAARLRTGPVTAANAQPESPGNGPQMAACLDKAALSLAVVADSQEMLRRQLSETFPARACTLPEPSPPRGLRWLMDTEIEFEKMMFDIGRRLCPAR